MKNRAGLEDHVAFGREESYISQRRYPIYRVYDEDEPDRTGFCCMGEKENLICIVNPDGSIDRHHKWAEELR